MEKRWRFGSCVRLRAVWQSCWSRPVCARAWATVPTGLALTPDGATALLTDSGCPTASVVYIATRTVARTTFVGDDPVGVTLAPYVARAVVTNLEPDAVTVVVLAIGELAATVPVGDGPIGLAVRKRPVGAGG